MVCSSGMFQSGQLEERRCFLRFITLPVAISPPNKFGNEFDDAKGSRGATKLETVPGDKALYFFNICFK